MDRRVLEPPGPRLARWHQDEQAELERALRENERKLVEAIGKDMAKGLALGHRTVSSTQLATSAKIAIGSAVAAGESRSCASAFAGVSGLLCTVTCDAAATIASIDAKTPSVQ